MALPFARWATWALLPVGMVAVGAWAEVNEEQLLSMSLEELVEVSIATGTPKTLQEAPAVASVITAKDLEDMGAQDLDEALETIPGLHVSHDSFQYASRYFIRGIVSTYNPQTLVLINGIPQTSLFLGDRGERPAARTGLPIKMIERVEIIRGPGSALYGADAFAGVINIITKNTNDLDRFSPGHAGTKEKAASDSTQGATERKSNLPPGQASLARGSFDTTSASLIQTGMLGEARTIFSLAYLRTAGDRPVVTSDAQSNIDAQLGTHASLAPGPLNLSDTIFDARGEAAWRDLRLRLAARRTEAGVAQGISNALDPDSHFIHHHATLDLTWRPTLPGKDWDVQTQTSYLYADFRNPGFIQAYPPGAFGGTFPQGVIGRPELFEQNARLDLTATYSGWQSQRWHLGGGVYWGEIFETRDMTNFEVSGPTLTPRPQLTDVSDTPAVFEPEGHRHSEYVFLQDEWRLVPHWELTAGVRRDQFSDFGGTTNPRLALVWQTSSSLTSKLLYGEAFRAPAFFELHATSNPSALGNPHLRPEKLRSIELAFSYKPAARWSWDLNIYHFRIRDYIDFVNTPGQQTFTAQNVGRIDGRGVETEWHWWVGPDLQLLANYSLQDTRNVDTNTPLGITPRDKIYFRAVWHLAPDWQLTPQVTREGETKRPAGDARAPLPAHTSVDLTLKHNWGVRWEAALIARNVFSADLREASRGPGAGQSAPDFAHDLPQPGRSLMLEIAERW